jgi:hypothetical protein
VPVSVLYCLAAPDIVGFPSPLSRDLRVWQLTLLTFKLKVVNFSGVTFRSIEFDLWFVSVTVMGQDERKVGNTGSRCTY